MIKMGKILPLLLLAALLKLSSSQNCSSGLNYSQFEKKILTERNVKVLVDQYSPINSHRKDIVRITYAFIWPENENVSLEYEHETISFHWLYSPVHLYINPEILQGLSLRTYYPEISDATLIVDLTEFCPDDLIAIKKDFDTITKLKDATNISELCNNNNNILILSLLNNLTANAHMYALGEKMHYGQEIHPSDRGYSVYYYHPDKPSKYCVINYEGDYKTQRYILNVGSLLIILFAVIGFPPLLVQFQEKIVTKLKRSQYWKLITKSVLIVSFFVILAIIGNNIALIVQTYRFYDSHSADILSFYCIFCIFCFLIWILDLIGILLALVCLNREKSKRSEDESQTKCCTLENCLIALACLILVYFFQLMSFHILYIVLGVMASSETLSILCSFVTAYIFTVIYVALLLKYLCRNCNSNNDKNRSTNNDKNRITNNDKNRSTNKNNANKCATHLNIYCLCSTIFFIAGIALVGGIVLLTTYFYRFPIVMEMTDRNEGLWGVVKSFLPAVFVSLLGFGGNRLLKIANPDQQHQSEQPTNNESSIDEGTRHSINYTGNDESDAEVPEIQPLINDLPKSKT